LNSKLDVVLISHNHYDHLDHATVQTISQLSPTTTFVVPLGVRTWFRDHVSTDISIYETDWHEGIECKYHTTNSSSETEGRSLHIQCLPMRHWSNRTGDRDQTLWCGYSLTTSGSPSGTTVDSSTRDEGGPSSSARNTHSKKVLFPGDTAWFDDLAEIGTTYGPFDVAAIPIGAYEPHDFMKTNHINVMEAVRMKDAVQAKAAVPIHWGTFPVTIEPVMEPREKLVECMKDRPDAETFTPWQIGETKLFD
jgi:L-ascorbate metabolism protein UlaG (beta-lactamase superfamily)